MNTEIELQLFAPAAAAEPPEPVDVVASLTTAGSTVTVQHDTTAARQITVGVLPVWGVALGWVLAIVLASQAVKSVLKATGFKERYPTPRFRPVGITWRKTRRHTWRRWMYVIPCCVGIVVSLLFGPSLGELFGLRFGLWTSVLILGPGSGAAAAFTYDVLRSVLLPVLPTAVILVVERVAGVTLPDVVKEKAQLTADTLDSEAFEDSEPLP